MDAVKNAMQRDEQDPAIMDLDPDESLESQRPLETSGVDDFPLNKDPAYEKYFKMLKMVRILFIYCTSNVVLVHYTLI